MTRPAAITAVGICKRLRRRVMLDGIDIVADAGEIVGICGENGAGKSTLLRILAGVLAPDSGTVFRAAAIGYAPQLPLLYACLTVREHFRFIAAARRIPDGIGERRFAELVERYNFSAWVDDQAQALSEGTRQKLNLSLALLSEPDVLLLDEPCGGFEWETYLRFWDHARELRAAGRTILVVSHLFHERQWLDRVVELRHGRLA
jgi:ABC-2 type transport system ATP-binding protein